jgi:hypothetical protein
MCDVKLGGPSFVSLSSRSHGEMVLLSWSNVVSVPPDVEPGVGGLLGGRSSVQAEAKTDEARIARVYPKRLMVFLLRT